MSTTERLNRGDLVHQNSLTPPTQLRLQIERASLLLGNRSSRPNSDARKIEKALRKMSRKPVSKRQKTNFRWFGLDSLDHMGVLHRKFNPTQPYTGVIIERPRDDTHEISVVRTGTRIDRRGWVLTERVPIATIPAQGTIFSAKFDPSSEIDAGRPLAMKTGVVVKGTLRKI